MARCSYCHAQGHNKRTCPKLTAALKRSADAAIEAGNPTAWAVREYEKRIAPAARRSPIRCAATVRNGDTSSQVRRAPEGPRVVC